MRRPDFAPGEGIILADGQIWSLPRPRARIVLRIERFGLVADPQWTCGGRSEPQFDASFWQELQAEPEDGLAVNLVSILLGRNYFLSPRQRAWLLRDGFDLRDAAGRLAFRQAWETLIPLAMERPGHALRRLLGGLPPCGPDGRIARRWIEIN
ncbi:MAG: hypothetical protein IRY99_08300 [Isosphaeraceae bacterium]|nr:hypothetical protein [Isosphaeraceae bacterium]